MVSRSPQSEQTNKSTSWKCIVVAGLTLVPSIVQFKVPVGYLGTFEEKGAAYGVWVCGIGGEYCFERVNSVSKIRKSLNTSDKASTE